MKRILCGILIALVICGGLAWANRLDLMLYIVKKRSEAGYTISPNREIAWKQGPTKPSDSNKPNIVMIVLDDVGYNDISAFGGGIAGGRIQTPNIDRFVSEGVVFTNSYAGNATCSPSRGMMMTGRYQTTTGYEFTPFPGGMGGSLITIGNSMNNGLPRTLPGLENNMDFNDQGLPGEEVTLAEILQEEGYHTVHIGKWHMGRTNGMAPNDQGFDESLLMHSGMYLPEDHPDVVNARIEFDPIDKFLWARLRYSASFNNASNDDTFEPGGYLTDYWTDESVKVIEANRNRPFFLYLAHWGTHTPLQATRKDYDAVGDLGSHTLQVYAAMMRAIDRSVGRVLKALEDTDQAENTVVVLTSDNGGVGYIGLNDLNAPYRGWKLTFFEGGLKVPGFMRWPAGLPEGVQIDVPMSHIDLMPTLVEAAGAALPADRQIDGLSLLPVARGQAGLPERPIFFHNGINHAVRMGDWKLQVNDLEGGPWLYNLSKDPTEQNNLAPAYPEKVAELHNLIKAHTASGPGALYPYSILAPVAIDKTRAETATPDDEVVYWAN